MASHVQVVLREDVDNLGTIGELVRVRPGYARNYLIPRGMAVIATRGNIEQIEHEQKTAKVRAQKLRSEAEGVASALGAVRVTIEKQAGEEGKLYGSVTAADVASALKAKGYEVDRRKIQMPAEPIKQTGEYELTAKLAAGVSSTFKVEVTAE